MVRRRKVGAIYDLWENKGIFFARIFFLCNEFILKFLEEGKTKIAKKRKNVIYLPSLLSAIDVPVEGASFNPSVESYTVSFFRVKFLF